MYLKTSLHSTKQNEKNTEDQLVRLLVFQWWEASSVGHKLCFWMPLAKGYNTSVLTAAGQKDQKDAACRIPRPYGGSSQNATID